MHGVTTALVGFLFVCVVFPRLIRNRPQYYAGFGLVCGIIILDALGLSIGGKFGFFVYFANAILQVSAMLVLFLAAGGLSWRELGTEIAHAFEVIRRGEDEKEVIVPLTGEMPKPRAESAPQRVDLDDPKPPDSRPSIPLE
jgi:hypothetical protein